MVIEFFFFFLAGKAAQHFVAVLCWCGYGSAVSRVFTIAASYGESPADLSCILAEL